MLPQSEDYDTLKKKKFFIKYYIHKIFFQNYLFFVIVVASILLIVFTFVCVRNYYHIAGLNHDTNLEHTPKNIQNIQKTSQKSFSSNLNSFTYQFDDVIELIKDQETYWIVYPSNTEEIITEMEQGFVLEYEACCKFAFYLDNKDDDREIHYHVMRMCGNMKGFQCWIKNNRVHINVKFERNVLHYKRVESVCIINWLSKQQL